MHKAARIFIAVFLLILGILIALPFAVNKVAIKNQIEKKISQTLGSNFTVKGNVGIRFLPLPQISLENVSADNIPSSNQYYNDVKIARLIIRPNVLSLFGNSTKINSLIFEKAEIENHPKIDQKTNPESDKSKPNNLSGGLFTNIFHLQDSDAEIFNIKNIEFIKFIEGSFAKKGLNQEVTLKFNNINFDLKNNRRRQIFIVEGNFISDEIPTNFSLLANVKNESDSKLTIQSPIINLIASGKFANSNIENLLAANFVGKIDAEIIDLKALLNKYFSKDNLLFHKINATQPIRLSANLSSGNNQIRAENITINSNIIAGSGTIDASFDNKPKVSANLSFDNIDIDSIWFSGALNSGSTIVIAENAIINKFNSQNNLAPSDENKSRIIDQPTAGLVDNQPLFPGLDLSANIKIKTAKYYGGTLEDVRFSVSTSGQGNIYLQPLSLKIPGGALKVVGTCSQENNIPKFVGKIEVSGDNFSKSLLAFKVNPENLKPAILGDYNFTSDLLALPSFTIFNNLLLSINSQKNIISGDIKIDDSAAISSSDVNLKINYFNYDDYFSANKTNLYLSKGSLLNKLLWINTLSSNRNIYLLFDQLVYGGNSFNNQALRVQFGQGYLKLSDLNLQSPNFDIKGNVDVDIRSNNPQLNFNITSQNMQFDAQNNIAEQFFNLPSLDEFNGDINFKIANLKLNSWEGNDINIAGKIKSGVIDFSNFTLKTYKGSLQYKGSVVLKNIKTINGSLELLGVDNSQVLDDTFNIKNISGISNISAAINSTAESKSDFFKNLDAKAQFISANITVKDFGLYDLAVKMVQPQKYQNELSAPNNILYAKGSESSFKDAAGAIYFKRGGNDNQFNIKVSTVGINGIVSGSVSDSEAFNGSANFIFISGSRLKPVPIALPINFNGKSGNIQQNTNLGQVEQYLGRFVAPPSSESNNQTINSTAPQN